MKKRLVSLLTAMLVAMTIFAVPVLANSTEATTNTTIESTEGTETTDPTEGTEEDIEDPEESGPVDISEATVTLPQASYGFTKKAVTPQVTVKIDGETLVEGNDYKVEYSNNIYPGTAKITITGINDYTGTITKTFGIATVKGLVWKKSTTSSIKIDWSARSNVTGYNVYRYNFSKSKWVFVKRVTTSEATIKNLIPGTGYQFRVRAIYKTGKKTYYSPVSTTIKIPTRPNKASITKVVNHPSLYANVYWGKKNSSGYQVKLARNAAFTKNAKTFKVTSAAKLNRKIINMKDNQQYYVKVRAYKTYGNKTTYGDWSKSKVFVTNGTRWYKVNGKQYYYKKGDKVTGTMKFGNHQYFFNYEDGAWSGASSKMWKKVKDSYSKTDYLIAVSRELNRICVYSGKKGNWKLKSYWMCTTGAPTATSISKTPTGSWLMPEEDHKLGYIGGHKDYTCWYATRFYSRCFFHSVLYEPASKVDIQDGRLGVNVSDGCIRMEIENAKWIYDNCDVGTRVIVY